MRQRLKIFSFYRRLLKRYGRQGWWPTTPAGSFHPIYSPGRRVSDLSEKDAFEICLGALLTQNTSWNNVEKVIYGLNQERLLSLERLRRLRRSRLERLLRSSGYFRQKTERLQIFMNYIHHVAAGSVKKFFRSGSSQLLREKLLSLKGIGPETADSMLLYAGGHPFFVVDAYTRRVGKELRFLKGDETYDVIQKKFQAVLPKSARIYGEYHALLVKYAKENR